MKKKYVLKSKMRFFSFITLFIIFIATIFFATSVYGYREPSYKTITIKRGDTLWDISKCYLKNGDIRYNIYKIKKLNNLASSDIYEGTVLRLPD